ncbi:acyl-ACP--UDP-N-acetylglucosamine O-acyltransferase [Parvibaculum sp.]|jgi:UDP-N-acetylglucosamine acyltransferase|uniref:acyl-ACP--UDP-N-acetylglucosamine O-acyltransferase n=1 Tax=Parvibaculum sp. TaxID=2024848 RepID=UPI000C68A11A|nr:acyl-ACP--UDP-N-acetylglucosamine O-acyltransferase [Parvibaculum sp.]HAC58714.1 acyl-[acyl-carrier-protein]--UDP-N-acetylglucosamine O-acyltransferase [Rhodobiaceae bacterium]MAU60690.1 acyl-[acyl-carrier-protein]--UDP-N-acetylglucosamine O-acyltransferase [Parvibaculum sp.]MBO6667565.1 acyl-ACP--UDP-N-acetylglucosamine O-acyltransferase [Parvibaculum sp.]MBO6692127.1 acyl-ACP--UDP-N-acetylglucosamine O-acyltransferase [Parvibaculum sp.]MBO6714117.1 acyl-ACP--UDP-N-acetylglucosamine O-acyl|tara:strand:+ start:15905 stop:16702 length:798 start_codon:yes stop_codon:yes gene_type:complete
MTEIHPTALVDPKADVAPSAKVGPYCVVGPNVVLGEGVVLHSHVVVEGRTSVGARTEIYPFASIGHQPQDLKYKGEPSTLEIGTDNLIREHVTMNPGTEGGGMVTRVGNHCAFLTASHVGHDSIVGNHVVFSNNVMLAGHCKIDDYVIFGGGAALHQFGRVGKHAFIGGMSAVENDVIPYGLVIGNRAHLVGLNLVGLRRRGFTRDQMQSMREAYNLLFAEGGTLRDRVEAVAGRFGDKPEVMEIVDFIRTEADRAICMPRSGTA